MEAALIGYRNHSARIMNLLLGFSEIDRLYVYYPDSNRLLNSNIQALSSRVEPTSDFSKLSGLDAVFITSPNRTHVEYIKSLIDQVSYLYCEKPPASTEKELGYLRSLEEPKKRKLYFNFNYRFSELAIVARDLIASGEIGNPINFNFVSTHGLAYRESFKSNWRSVPDDRLSGIFGNVSIHHIDLCTWLLGDFKRMDVEKKAWSRNSSTADSVYTTMNFQNGCTASIFVSYAAPFINRAQLIFNDGFLELDEGTLKLYSPRESYDDSGRFTKPPSKEILASGSSREYYNYSLQNSLKYFMSVISGHSSFDLEDFNQSLRSNIIIFSY